jgi:hypothetical protein
MVTGGGTASITGIGSAIKGPLDAELAVEGRAVGAAAADAAKGEPEDVVTGAVAGVDTDARAGANVVTE